MNKTVKIKFSEFTKASNQAFTDDAVAIKNAVEENAATFPESPVTIATLEDETRKLIDLNALADSDNGSHNDRTDRQAQRDTVYQLIVTIGLYVLTVADTKETYTEKKGIVELAAYPVANDTHTPVEKLPVTGLKVETSNIPGVRTIEARWKRGKCAAFIVQGTQGDANSPSTAWTQLAVSSKARCEVTLEPGNWAVRVIGLYNSGQAAPSAPVLFSIS